MAFSGIDPDLCRDLAATLRAQAALASGSDPQVAAIAAAAQLGDLAAAPCSLMRNGGSALGKLGTLLLERSQLMEMADTPSPAMHSLADKVRADINALEAFLNSTAGAAYTGSDAVRTLIDTFADIDTNHDGKISLRELNEAAAGKSASAKAAKYLLDNPTMLVDISDQRFDDADQSQARFSRPDDHYFTKAGLEGVLKENDYLTVLLEHFSDIAGKKNSISLKDLQLAASRAPAGSAARSQLAEAADYFLAHRDAWKAIDTGSEARLNKGLRIYQDGKVSLNDIFALGINSQAFTGGGAGASESVREIVLKYFPNVAKGQKSLDMRLVSDDGLRALAIAGLSQSQSLSQEVEFVASLPESPLGTRNRLIAAYYDLVGRDAAKWQNPQLANPLDVTDPDHTGWSWLPIGASAANSVSDSITGAMKLPGGISLNWSERNALADGNQQIFTDVAVRISKMIEFFPTGSADESLRLKAFFESSSPTGPLFGKGDKQIRDAMFFMLASRDSSDPAQRQKLNFQASMSIATHEQASIDGYLKTAMGANLGDDGLRGLMEQVGAAAIGSSPEQMAVQMRGVMTIGDGADATNLKLDTDLDKQKSPIPSGGPISKYTLKQLSPLQTTAVTIGGVPYNLDGSNLGLKKLTGWETKGFEVDPAQWMAKGGNDQRTILAPGPLGIGAQLKVIGTDKITKPMENTGVTDWTNFDQRMYFVGELFHAYTFDPALNTIDLAFSKARLDTNLSFVPPALANRLATADKLG